MKIIAMIPARYGATRFPGKLVADLGGKPVIARTYEAAVNTGLFDEVIIVTDSDIITDAVKICGAPVVRSIREHECGTDRIAEAAEYSDADIVVNIQGDEPFVNKAALEKLLSVFDGPDAASIDLASLMQEMTNLQDISDPNFVKVVTGIDDFALYFSRSPIPYPRDKETPTTYYEHIGVYAFRKQALMDFYRMALTPLEATEKIECNRFLEYGKKIKMVTSAYMGVEIDTPDDLLRAEAYLNK
ncbi:MAG: 3-deoxy-manno-octulosonate cytidylyltransferase [Ferruginibacter sp.]